MSAGAALVVAAALAGCGKTFYFAGRVLPPSGLQNRVMIAIQNPGTLTKGELQIVDAFYDTRSGYNGKPAFFSICRLRRRVAQFPSRTCRNNNSEPFTVLATAASPLIDYKGEKTTTASVGGLNGLSSSVFMTRNEAYVFAASQTFDCFHGGESECRFVHSSQPSRRVPRQR